MKILIQTDSRAQQSPYYLKFEHPIPGGVEAQELRLRNYAIYDSQPLIYRTNRTFILGGTSYQIGMGNYTGPELASHLDGLVTGAGYTVTYNARLPRFDIDHGSIATPVLSIPSKSLQRILGMREVNTGSAMRVSSTCIPQLTSSSYFQLVFNNIPPLYRQTKPYHFIILNDTGLGGLNTPKMVPHRESVPLGGIHLDHLDIEIRDMDYELVDGFGIDLMIEIELCQ